MALSNKKQNLFYNQLNSVPIKMKKVFYLAITAIASLSIVSCSGNGNASVTSADSTTTEATEAAEQPAEEVKIEDQTELSCNEYVIAVPEGWKATSRMVNSSCNLALKGDPYTRAMLNCSLEKEENLVENYKKGGFKAVDDITVGDKTWKVYLKDGDRPEYKTLLPLEKGFITLGISPAGTQKKGDELKEIVTKNLQDIMAAITVK